MSDWTEGYVADIDYTYGYYQEMNPLRAELGLLSAGLHCPEFRTACELGFGQGISANLHAAGSQIEWYGTDFNPSQASMARELAGISGAGARLYDDAFAEFCARDDLPNFDFIALHGIWSWISDENRQVLVDFIQKKLNVGGVLYVSYNTMPGWAAFAPMRDLMTQHAEIIGVEGRGIVSRIEGALDFAERLLATNPTYGRANPQVSERIKKLKEQNRHYLAHEYFNRDWHPMPFSRMAEWLQPAKVNFACSAYLLDQIDHVNLTPDQQKFMQEIPDTMLRQSVRDFMVNQQFRRDYWIKGPRKMAQFVQIERIRAQRIILVTHRPDIALKVTGPLGEAQLSDKVYAPLLDALASHEIKTIGQLEKDLASKGIALSQILQAIMVMVSVGHIQPAQADAAITKSKPNADKLNQHIMSNARGSGEIVNLVSPVTGGGVPAARFNQLFLQAYKQGKKNRQDWVTYVWSILVAQKQLIMKNGAALKTEQENIDELNHQATEFEQKLLPALIKLKIA